jgi:protein transport protein HofQ
MLYRNLIYLVIFFSISMMSNAYSEEQKRLNLEFLQADVAIILQSLAKEQGLNLVMNSQTDQLITLTLHDVSWQNALDIVLKQTNLAADIHDNILFIHELTSPQDTIEQLKQQQKQALYTQSLAYLTLKINHIEGQELITMIKQNDLLSERGKLYYNQKSSTLIIHDVPTAFSEIKQLIQIFDQPQPQVQISARIVTMSDESLSALGIDWGYQGHNSQTVNQLTTGLNLAHSTLQLGVTVANLAGNLLNLELAALEAENKLDIIANPSLLTTHLMPASIRQGTEIPYEVSAGSNGGNTIEFKQAVLGLDVTPRILNDNLIELDLHISQNAAGQAIKKSDGGEALAIDTQEIQTKVIVKQGQTLVLGGIFQQAKSHTKQQIPTLGKLPLIGKMFRYQQQKQHRRQLVIFITPQLIKIDTQTK